RCRVGAVEVRRVVFPGGRENVRHADIDHLFELFRDLSSEAGPVEMTRIEETRPERRGDAGNALRQRSIGRIAEDEAPEAEAVFAHKTSPPKSAMRRSSELSRLAAWSRGEV